MKIKVSNPNKLPTIDYRKVKPLQGDLKDLTEENYTKLKEVLLNRGFKVPFFLWKTEAGDFYFIDGHQRQRVMKKEQMTPYEVPYVLIEAKNIVEAKAQLLEISSQYGTITQEGFDAFIADLPEFEYKNTVFDALHFRNSTDGEDGDEEDLETRRVLEVTFETDADMEELFNELKGRSYQCRILTL